MRRFLWGGVEANDKISCVKWDNICKPKLEGGLGIKDLNLFSLALLGKWRWRLLHDRDSLWAKVLKAKYDGECPQNASV